MTNFDRRDFLKLVGAGGVGVGAGFALKESSRRPVEQYIPYVVTPEDYSPGVATWYNTVCRQCSAGCGIKVRVREGRAKKVEGNPSHPVSQGRTCALGQASLNALYNPDRVQAPSQRAGERGAGKFNPVDWEQGLNNVAEKIGTLSRNGQAGAVRFLTGNTGGHLHALCNVLSDVLGATQVQYDFTRPANLLAANRLAFGESVMPYYDIANAGLVVSFGADFLGPWLSPVHHAQAYGTFRQGQRGRTTASHRGHLVQVEPRMSLTGAAADEWIAARPGTEGLLALGIAQQIVSSGAFRGGSRGSWTSALQKFGLDSVAQRTGVAPDRITSLAQRFVSDAPALAVGGGAMANGTNGVANLLAINALNIVAGSVGKPGGILFNNIAPLDDGAANNSWSDLLQLRDDMNSGAVELLVVADTNPVFTLPESVGFTQALGKVPYIVSLGSFLDETSAMADLILPSHTSFEAWGDDSPDPGVGLPVASVSQPVVAPIFDTRDPADIVLQLARRIGEPAASALPWENARAFVQHRWNELYTARHGTNAAPGFDEFWRAVVEAGVWGERPVPRSGPAAGPEGGLEALFDWAGPQFDGDAASYPYHFQPFMTQGFLDGRGANLPWIQELPDPMTSIVYGSWVELNPATAAELGVTDGDVLSVTSAHGSVSAPVHVSPAIRPDTIAMPIGQGHTHYGRYAKGRGANPLQILGAGTDGLSGELAWSATRVALKATGKTARIIRTDGTPRTLGRQILGPTRKGGH